MENIKAKIQGILLNCSQKSVIGWAVEEDDFEAVAEEIVKNLALSDVVQRSELLLAVICEYNKINTYKEIKKVEKWLEKWDSK